MNPDDATTPHLTDRELGLQTFLPNDHPALRALDDAYDSGKLDPVKYAKLRHRVQGFRDHSLLREVFLGIRDAVEEIASEVKDWLRDRVRKPPSPKSR